MEEVNNDNVGVDDNNDNEVDGNEVDNNEADNNNNNEEVPANEEDDRIEEYHREFNFKTNDGAVLNRDLSLVHKPLTQPLTADEKEERSAWLTSRQDLFDFYDRDDDMLDNYRRYVNSTTRLLKQQVPAPPLKEPNVSSVGQATDRRTRMYPPSIGHWAAFDDHVISFNPRDAQIAKPKRNSPLYLGLQLSTKLRDERGEQEYIEIVVLEPLAANNLLQFDGGQIAIGCGKPDLVLCTVDKELLLPIEFKATHNLMLPLEAESLVQKYNNAYNNAHSRPQRRSTEWVNICHPIAQITVYMVDNEKWYGVLSSGTRTYFLRLIDSGSSLELQISGGWLVGYPNYLRAWAYIFNCAKVKFEAEKEAEKEGKGKRVFRKPSWIVKTPPTSPNKDDSFSRFDPSAGSDDNSNDESGDRKRKADGSPSHSLSLFSHEPPFVPYSAFGTLRVIGHGKNGCAFAAHWKGQEVALKQFDISKGGYDSYLKELEAYSYLRSAWGDLVVKPLFVSESWTGNVKFLGMQLGRRPSQCDQSFQAEKSAVLSRLFYDYGFSHKDDSDYNFVYIPGDGGDAKDKLVVIDLEHYSVC